MVARARSAVFLVVASLGACSSSGDARDHADQAARASTASVTTHVSPLVRALDRLRDRRGERRVSMHAGRILVDRDGRSAEVTLSTTADAAFVIIDEKSGVAWAPTLVGAQRSPAEIVDGVVLYRRGLRGRSGAMADLVHVPGNGGTEDFVELSAEADDGTLTYDIALGDAVAGVRVSSNVVEALDASGTPRLRVSHPYVIDALGEKHWATLSLTGCTVDDRPGEPWGRAPIAPGKRTCRLVIAWDRAALPHPIVVDPAWTTTNGFMSAPRYQHAAALLSNGRVLIVGGGGCTTPLSTAEIYDPATGTFAATAGAMSVGRINPEARVMAGGAVLVTDGYKGTVVSSICSYTAYSTAEHYDPATAKFVAAPSLGQVRFGSTASPLADGRVLVAGGLSSGASGASAVLAAQIYNPSTKTFSTVGSMLTGRSFGTSILLSNGKVLLVGGQKLASPATELFNPSTNTFASTGAPTDSGAGALATIDSNRVLWASGYTSAIYTVSTGAFASGPSTPVSARIASPFGTSILLGNLNDDVMLYVPSTGTFTQPTSAPSASIGSLTAILGGTAVLGVTGSASDKQAYVFATMTKGSACGTAADCQSGFCVDGVCCDTSCTGTCMGCSAAVKGAGSDGTCGPAAAGKTHRSCATSSCTAGVQTNAQVCNASQQCISAGTTPCAPYGCAAKTCANACTTQPDCGTGFFCSAGSCVPSLADGSACSAATDCTSGHCVDGVCCNQACDGMCVACTTVKKGTGANGQCEPIKAGADPDGECLADGAFPTSCKSDGMCDGAGACRENAPAGTVCGNTACTSGVVDGQMCDGSGTCALSSASCAPGVCNAGGTACTRTCSADTECATSAFCSSSGECAARRAAGAACSRAAECATRYCADGVCCNTPCTGACESCAETGSVGVCAPVKGAPRAPRAMCAGGATTCGGSCNGTDTSACTYPPSTTECGSTCASGTVSRSLCDGQGACAAQSPQSCGAYVCGATSCKTSCASGADCATGHECDAATSRCVPQRGAACSDDGARSQPTDPSQPAVECVPYRCNTATGGCFAACESSDACGAGASCDQGRCVLPPTSEASGGCAFVDAREGGASSGIVALALFALTACKSRSRHRRRRARCAHR